MTLFCCPSAEPGGKKRENYSRVFFHVWKNVSKEVCVCVCRFYTHTQKDFSWFYTVEPTEIFFFRLWNRVKKKMFSEKCHNKRDFFVCATKLKLKKKERILMILFPYVKLSEKMCFQNIYVLNILPTGSTQTTSW